MNIDDCRKHFTFEPEAEYHARSKTGECMSSHMLRKFAESAAGYFKLISEPPEEKKSDAFRFGTAVHCAILEPEKFSERYHVSDGPVNPKTEKPFGRATKEYAAWLAALGEKEVLSGKEWKTLEAMRESVMLHPECAKLFSAGWAEGVIRTEYAGTLCQIRVDWFNPEAGIVDLKTCDELKWFEADARRYDYPEQMAFYRSIVEQKTGMSNIPVHIVAVEKSFPHNCGVWHIDGHDLDFLAEGNRALLVELATCREDEYWPTNYENVRELKVW